MHTFLSYFDLKCNLNYAFHMKISMKMMFFGEFLLTLFFIFWGRNSKKAKHREILHFKKHSSLCNRVGKRTILFIFSFFHFLCNLRISRSPLSITKNETFSDLHYIFFINFSFIWFFFMFECKLCKKISIMKHLNEYFSLIIQFQSFWFFT